MFKRIGSSFAAAFVIGGLLLTPAQAQSASEMTLRMQQLEGEVRQLMGQVEELTFEVKQLKKQIGTQKSGAADPVPAQPGLKPKVADVAQAEVKQADVLQPEVAPADQADASAPLIESQSVAPISGAEQITENGQSDIGGGQSLAQAAPAPQILGSMNNSASRAGDGGFQGKVLVAPSQEDAPAQETVAMAPVQVPAIDQAQNADGNGVEQVSLAPDAATANTAEGLYQSSYDAVMQRRFSDAQQGFTSLIQNYPDHNLVGPAYYWLGETYFAQSDYKSAAQQFLTVYKQYPKSSKAPDGMVKLGVSLVKLGNAQQGCAVYDTVATQFPKAAQAIKRAQLEAKRAGCGS